MIRVARSLTESGIGRFRAYLQRLRSGAPDAVPWDLLDDPGATRELPVDAEFEQTDFPNRLTFAKHIVAKLEALPPDEADRDAGLWDWLALFYFDQLCPAGPDGHRRPGVDYRHVRDSDYRYRYRHLVYGPYQVYRRHGIKAFPLLSGPLHLQNSIYQEIAGRQDLVANRGVIEAVMLLFFDPPNLAPKRGAQATGARPGSIRRLVRVLQQLDMTYDIYGMKGTEILELLPAEFDEFRPRQLSQI